jgi:integrase/recombinase XerD
MVAIQAVYYRQKIEGTGRRYRPLTVGRRPEAAKNGPYFIRVRNSAGKYQWVKHETERAAERAAKAAPVARQAQELGLTVDDLTKEANTNRGSIKTAVENYLQDRRFGRPRSIAAYENAFDQLLENLPRGIRFIDQLATSRALNSYVEFLREQDHSNKTISIRMGFVFSLPKANGVETPSKLIKLPKVQRTRTKAYNPDELSKLFAAMTPEEYLRYLFFVRTGCREQEVQYATWKDLDLKGLRFMVSGEGKSDVALVPKNHEERQVPFTTELGSLLADHKKHAVSDRWLFTNGDAKPEGHFLRKFKAIAKRAGLNCGQCKVAIREGRYDNRHEVEVTCETRPVCEEHYLHRLRKTAATNWLRSGFDLMKIKSWLGHKSLEVTQIYLDSEMHDPEEQKKLDRAGKF